MKTMIEERDGEFAVLLPDEALEALNLTIGDEVELSLQADERKVMICKARSTSNDQGEDQKA